MDFFTHLVKYILYTFNLVFAICGILLVGLGTYMIRDIEEYSSFLNAVDLNIIPIIVIGLGTIVFMVACFGCCGSIRENLRCTTIYSMLMFTLFVLQVVLVTWVFIRRQQFLNTMGKVVDQVWERNNDANCYPMDGLQITFNCCGHMSYTDYTHSGKPVPNSCCGPFTKHCSENVYEKKHGCRKNFLDFWSLNMNLIRYAGIFVALVELMAFTFARCLINSIQKTNEIDIKRTHQS